MPRATIDDVAELAGVSIKTVSRVVNREPNVRQSTREKVDRAIAKLKYRRNLSARSLAMAGFWRALWGDPVPEIEEKLRRLLDASGRQDD